MSLHPAGSGEFYNASIELPGNEISFKEVQPKQKHNVPVPEVPPVEVGKMDKLMAKVVWWGTNVEGTDSEERVAKRSEMRAVGGERLSLEVSPGIKLDGMFFDSSVFADKLNAAGARYCQFSFIDKDKENQGILIPRTSEGQVLLSHLKKLKFFEAGAAQLQILQGTLIYSRSDSSQEEMESDEVRLSNLFISDDPINCENQATVVITGGALARYEYASDEAMAFLLNGMNVLMYNIRGYGQSGGVSSESSLDHDLEFICDYLRNEKNIPDEKILLKGNCLGGAVTARCAAKPKNAKVNVMLDQTFADFKNFSDTLAARAKLTGQMSHLPDILSPLVVAFCARRLFPDYATDEELKKMTNNVCLIVNESDELIPTYGHPMKTDTEDFSKHAPTDSQHDEVDKLITALPSESHLKHMVALRGIKHCCGWYEIGDQSSNELGLLQVNNFLERTNLRRNLFENYIKYKFLISNQLHEHMEGKDNYKQMLKEETEAYLALVNERDPENVLQGMKQFIQSVQKSVNRVDELNETIEEMGQVIGANRRIINETKWGDIFVEFCGEVGEFEKITNSMNNLSSKLIPIMKTLEETIQLLNQKMKEKQNYLDVENQLENSGIPREKAGPKQAADDLLLSMIIGKLSNQKAREEQKFLDIKNRLENSLTLCEKLSLPEETKETFSSIVNRYLKDIKALFPTMD